MKPYNETDLPLDIKYDMTLMTQLLKAKEVYIKYTTMIEYSSIDRFVLLRPLLFQEAYKSMELAGAKISQESLYDLKYDTNSVHHTELFNCFHLLQHMQSYLNNTFKLSVGYLNRIHKDVFKHPDFTYKQLGQYRQKLTWIGLRGKTVYEAEYVPTHPFDIPLAMTNFIKHFNKGATIDPLIDIALSHAQFENIHPYLDGNGRLGRLLIPLHGLTSSNQPFSLFLSEVIKKNEYAYHQSLQALRQKKVGQYIKFFLRLIVEQLTQNTRQLDEAIHVYESDLKRFKDLLNEKNAQRVFEYFFSTIRSTIKDAADVCDIKYQTMRHYINKLHDNGILERHKIHRGEYVYTYIKLYSIYVPVDWV